MCFDVMSLSVTSLLTLLKQLVRCASTSSLHPIALACLIHLVIVTIILKFIQLEVCGKNQDIHLMREEVRKRINIYAISKMDPVVNTDLGSVWVNN